MAASAQIANVSYSHEAIIDWMLSNPDKNQGECATTFGYTQAWLSTIIHSDAFRAEYQRRRSQLNEYIANGIHAKLAEVSKKALDKIETYLDGEETDPRLVLDVADKMLHRQGYAPSRNGVTVLNQQFNNYNPNAVDQETLRAARGIMRALNVPKELMTDSKETPAIEHTNPGTGQ